MHTTNSRAISGAAVKILQAEVKNFIEKVLVRVVTKAQNMGVP